IGILQATGATVDFLFIRQDTKFKKGNLILLNQIHTPLIYKPLQRILLLPFVLVTVLVEWTAACAKVRIRKCDTPSVLPGMAIRMRPADWFSIVRLILCVIRLHVKRISDLVILLYSHGTGLLPADGCLDTTHRAGQGPVPSSPLRDYNVMTRNI